MSPTFAAELLKLRTTRTALGFLAAALLLTAFFVTVGVLAGTLHTAEDSLDTANPSFAPLLALIGSIVGVTGEYRHGTIASTLCQVAAARFDGSRGPKPPSSPTSRPS